MNFGAIADSLYCTDLNEFKIEVKAARMHHERINVNIFENAISGNKQKTTELLMVWNNNQNIVDVSHDFCSKPCVVHVLCLLPLLELYFLLN